MTVRELEQHVGKQVLVRAAEFQVPAIIADVKRTYGRVRFRAVARGGASGEVWLEADRIISGLEEHSEQPAYQPAGHTLV